MQSARHTSATFAFSPGISPSTPLGQAHRRLRSPLRLGSRHAAALTSAGLRIRSVSRTLVGQMSSPGARSFRVAVSTPATSPPLARCEARGLLPGVDSCDGCSASRNALCPPPQNEAQVGDPPPRKHCSSPLVLLHECPLSWLLSTIPTPGMLACWPLGGVANHTLPAHTRSDAAPPTTKAISKWRGSVHLKSNTTGSAHLL